MEFLKSGPTPAQVEVRRLMRKRIREVPPNYRRGAKKAVWPLVGAREEYIFNALEPGDASCCKFDCVLFWALNRFSREGMVPTIHHLERLNSYGVTFHSYTEPHLCADKEMVRGILLAVLAQWPSRRPSGFRSA